MTREDYLKGLIIKRFGSIRKFAEYTGIASSTITSMLSKGVGGTSVDTVIKICKALGITVEELQNIESKDNIKKESNKPTTIAAHLLEGVEHLSLKRVFFRVFSSLKTHIFQGLCLL